MLLLLLATEDFLLVALESLSSCGRYLHESMSSFSTRNLVFYLGQVISNYLFSLLLMLLLLSQCLAIPVLGDFDLTLPVPLAIQLLHYYQWRTQGGGMGGPDPPTFQKVGPRDSHKNVIKLMGGGSGRSVKKRPLRSLKSNQRLIFLGFAARFWFLRNA